MGLRNLEKVTIKNREKEKKLVETVENGILEAFLLKEESPASQQAKSMGMKYVGFGRWSDGKMTYKSDGANLVPMDKAKGAKGGEKNFLEEFVKKCNAVAESKKSGNTLLKTMVSMLPGREKGEHYGKTEVLEQILNSAIPYFNKFVLTALKNKKFRSTLLKEFLNKFEKNIGEKSPLEENPEIAQQSKNVGGAVSKPNVPTVNPLS